MSNQGLGSPVNCLPCYEQCHSEDHDQHNREEAPASGPDQPIAYRVAVAPPEGVPKIAEHRKWKAWIKGHERTKGCVARPSGPSRNAVEVSSHLTCEALYRDADPAVLWRRAPVPFLFARRADAEAPDTVETLRDALGSRAEWLARPDLRARTRAAWFVQQETRSDMRPRHSVPTTTIANIARLSGNSRLRRPTGPPDFSSTRARSQNCKPTVR